MDIEEYFNRIRPLDKLKDISSIKLGLFGEVGSILTLAKKRTREGDSFDYINNITEELGDAFWYFCRLVDRLGLKFNEIIPSEYEAIQSSSLLATNFPKTPIAHAVVMKEVNLEITLPMLGTSAAKLLYADVTNPVKEKSIFKDFLFNFFNVIKSTDISFSSVLLYNLEKSEGRFLLPNIKTLPRFDDKFDADERLPENFSIQIIERKNGKSYLKYNDVFIGDPLTDNIAEQDGYRFHDVFHMANAAILHWSPTFRSLIRHKRKSDPEFDEIEDGGRAIVIEEGLTAWIFSYAKEDEFFANREHLSFDLLKRIKQFVKGYEVESCPVSLWEKSIIDGYKVFRELSENKSGTILGNRMTRTIEYRR